MIINAHNFPSSTPITLVTSLGASLGLNGGTSSSINTTGANLIVIVVASYSLGATSTPTDSKGNTYTGLTAVTGGTSRNRIFYCASPTVGSGHTFTYSATTSASAIHVMAFSGVHASPYVSESTGSSGSATTISAGSVTPATNGALIVSGLTWDNFITGPSIAGPMSISTSNAYSGGSVVGGASAYYVQPTAAAVNPTWSWTNARGVGATAAVFKAA